ncbi:hypothetical protein [Pseudomonas sp. SJZ080]|uniref:hypothetical protein n=1 Tax=Pseudomonas sp. SJZ080 TaxID=2572888 RepID=UPI0011A25777|nr:hypothetical protein [Pseudomonas sp. SJZ080]
MNKVLKRIFACGVLAIAMSGTAMAQSYEHSSVASCSAGGFEFECDLLIGRTQSGIDRAKVAGKRFGRPPTFNTQERAAVMEKLVAGVSIAEVASHLRQ